MGNSPSKNDPLPNTSSSSVDESSPEVGEEPALSALSKSSPSKSHGSGTRTPSKARSMPKKTSGPSPHDLDLEIDVSMAQLLSRSPHESSPCGSSLESTSPVFTAVNETRNDQDLVSSFGSYSSSPKGPLGLSLGLSLGLVGVPGSDFDSDTLVGNLDPISENSGETTPEPLAVSERRKTLAEPTSATSEANVTASFSYLSLSSESSESPPVPSKSNFPVDIDGIIEKLVQIGNSKSKLKPRRYRDKLPVSNDDIKYILNKSRSIFLDQPALLRLSPPVKIVGDIHGQFGDMIRMFNTCGYPPFTNYLFLGDYVDRGYKSLETILLLLCYKIKYPENFFMLRGNHELANITKIYGFYDECKRRLLSITGNHKVWKSFVDVFNTLPIAATINDKIFCVHGGLSPDLQDLEQIENLKRPTDVPDKGLLADLLWSDPDPKVKNFTFTNWPRNDRGVSYVFGRKHVDYFCQKFNFDLVVRGHMVVEDGYEFFNKRKLVTIFLAPNYCGEFNNFGALMNVDKSLCCSFELLKPA